MKKLVLTLFVLVFAAIASSAQDLGVIDPVVQKQVGVTLTAYYGVKDALIDSKANVASAKANEILRSLDAVDATKMSPVQKTQWDKLEKLIRTDSVHINRNKEVEHQREHFMKLSNNMYALVFGFKANETEAYLQYCPMKKASWLSKNKDIKNPYFGSKMLTCGSVKATVKKGV
ncbi:MAG: DUF3347 domain-containing protein [Pyrinomonadaceae bacterium]